MIKIVTKQCNNAIIDLDHLDPELQEYSLSQDAFRQVMYILSRPFVAQ